MALVLASLLPNVVSGQQERTSGKFEPPPGKTMVLVGCGWDDAYETYKRLTGDVPAGGLFWYDPAGDPSFFRHNARNNVGPDGVLLIHYTMAPSKNYVPDILAGRLDGPIEAMGDAFKEWGGPVFVIIGPEFDHKDHRKDYTAAQYVRAYRHIHDAWARRGAANVAYVWHTVCDDLSDRTWEYYPGDGYVDWFGLSLYFDYQARQASTFARMARARRKPLMVAEAGPPNGTARTFDDWHGPLLRLCRSLDARVVGYNNFREVPTGDVFKDSAFDRLPPRIAEDWGREMKKPRYLHASPDLHRLLGHEGRADGRGPGDAARTQDGPQVVAGKAEVRIRRVAFSLDEKGAGELVVDARDGEPGAEDEPGAADEPVGDTTLAGLPNARVVPLGGNSFRIVHDFGEHEGASDFSLLAGVVPLNQEGLAIDRDAGELIMTPARREGRSGTSAKLIYPRFLRPPLRLALDVARFDRGTLVLSSKPMGPDGQVSGTLAVNLSPGPEATRMAVSWRPNEGGKEGAWMGLLEQGIEPGELSRRAFRLPPGAVSGTHRIPLDVAIVGTEPVRLRRLEVEAVVVPMIGVGFGPAVGEARVASVLKGGPAEEAGLLVGDVVTAIDGEPVTSQQDAVSRVGQARIGQEMRLSVRRGGRAMEIVIRGE